MTRHPFVPYIVLDDIVRAYEDSWREAKEMVQLSPDTTLSAALNKCPAEWIDAICKAIGVRWDVKREKIHGIVERLTDADGLGRLVGSLSEECRGALVFVLERGGWVKYGQLSRRAGREDGGFFWTRSPPRTVIGVLRLHGLLFVGRSGLGGRTYKVAVVPRELRPLLERCLGLGHLAPSCQSRLV